MITFTLPAPPSTNELYSGRRFKTARYKTWIHDAGWTINTHRHKGPVTGPFNLTIYLPGRCDLDNIKAIPDLLVSMGIIPDDRRQFMKKLTVVPIPREPCHVEIEPL